MTVPELAGLFETNRFIVYSVYGQVFLVMGLAVVLQSRRYSELALARRLWLLGAFGILHGLSEWGFVFIPVQEQYMAATVIDLLWLAHTVLVAASFAFLFQFGVELVSPRLRIGRLHLLPGAVFVLWGLLFFLMEKYFVTGVTGQSTGALYATGDVLARYLLALPGGFLVALGLLREAKVVEQMDLPGIARYLLGAAVAFLAYVLLAGLLVEPVGFFPASVLNHDLVLKALGIPVVVFRSLCGLVIAYCTVRALKIFDVEMDRMIEKMRRARTLGAERERFGRELHDGTIQSIYAVGLQLEDMSHSIESDPALARQKVRHVMELLNQIIADIRNYIVDLNVVMENREFEDQLRALAREFAEGAGVAPQVIINSRRRPLTAEQAAQLLQVAREALANISRHAAASRAEMCLTYGKDTITLEIRDDGRGFDPKAIARRAGRGQKLGLRNLARRIETIGGTLRIQTALRRGTKVTAKVPLEEVTC